MDITTTELKTMKAKQLRRLIQEVINEDVLNEDPTKSKNLRIQAAKLSQQAATLKKQAADEETKDAQQDTQAAANESLDEMARLAKGFRLADPNINTSQYATKRISGTSMADVIEFFRENPGAEKTALQAQFGFVRPQIANAIVNGLLDAGVLVKLRAGGEEEVPVAPGETAPTQATEPEDMFMGSAENPLSMYFDDEPNADGSENFTDDEEPDAGEIEKSNMAAGGMSDADYEAWMKYGELKQRLDSTKSNILKLRKNKGGSFGDISDKPSTELQRLRDLKLSLEERIAALVASSPYLQAKLKKEEPIVPVIEPEEETEVEPLDEWTIRKMQYYAGISK